MRSAERPRSDNIRGIIISPTRELAEQIAAEANKLCRFTRIKVQTAVGGHNKREMLQRTRREGCHLLVGTPGRLLDLLTDEYSGIAAPNLDALILDEADRLIEVGFERELQQIVQALPDRRQKDRQTLLFSATLPKNVVSVARSYINPSNFQFVQTINAEEAPTHEKVPQHIVTTPGFEHWAPALMELTEKAMSNPDKEQPFKAIVFFNNTVTVKLMGNLFRDLKESGEARLPLVYQIHSDLDQRQRTRVADYFRQATSAILISTDVTARGMDFPNVSHVIQFGVPPSREQYIHRLGRTGRANKPGQGYLVIQKAEIDAARYRLPGLPIKRSDELEVAKVDTSSGKLDGLPGYFSVVNRAMRSMPRDEIAHTYVRLLTGSLPFITRRDEQQNLVDSLNHWVTFQGQLSTPPPVSAKASGRSGGRLQGLNMGRDRDSDSERDFGRGSNFGGRDDRSGRFGRGPPSRDPFRSMEGAASRSSGRGFQRKSPRSFF